MLIFTLGAMILSLILSATDWDIMTPAKWRGGGNFMEAFFDDGRFWISLRATMLFTFLSVPCGLAMSLSIALLLNVKVKGIPFFRTCFYLPSLASAVASALVWRKIFQQDGGLLNLIIYGSDGRGGLFGLSALVQPLTTHGQHVNWLGTDKTALGSLILMSVWGVGGGMMILLAGLQGTPEFYCEAAELDGAGPWNRFKVITFPMLTPALLFTLITGDIGSFQVFTQAFVMTPFYLMLVISLKTPAEINTTSVWAIPQGPTLANFAKVLTNPTVNFALFFRNSLIVATLATLGGVLTSAFTAYGFSRIQFRGRDRLFLLVLSTMMLPAIVTMIPTYIFFKYLHWVYTLYPLIYLNDTRLQTLEVGLSTYNSLRSTEWHFLMAGSVLVSVPLILIFFVGQRYFVRGIALTGGK